MNDHLGQLQQALSDAAVREYGARTRRRRSSSEAFPAGENGATSHRAWVRSLRRWPPFALAALVLAICATAGAAIVVLVDRGSAPLSGSVPSLRALHYDVPLTPDLEAGDVGWCSDPRFSISGVRSPYDGGGACAPAYRPGSPIVLAGGEPISNAERLLKSSHTPVSARQDHTDLFWAIVTSRVSALRLRPGDVVAARRYSQLPLGWKAVVAFVSGQIDPVALDGAGRVIREPSEGRLPTITRATARSIKPGRPATSSPCSIHAPRLPEVTASWGVIATRVPRLGIRVTSNALFSCARSWYSIKGFTEAPSAAILLSARDPRRAAPALPGLKSTGRPGIFIEDGGADGPLLATRVGRAWLVVQGPSTSIDAMLLGALRIEGTAFGPTGQR